MAGPRVERSGARWVVVGVIVAAGALLVWLLTRGPSSTVLVVGDSVTFMSAASIDGSLGSDVGVQAVAVPGYTSTDLLPLVEEAIEGKDMTERSAVFLVGYNDVIHRRTGSPELERLVEVSAGFECSVWLTLPTNGGAPSPGYDALAAAGWNESVRSLVEPHPNVHVFEDWSKSVDAAVDGEPLTVDGIHPNAAGQALLGESMAAAVDHFCP